MKILKRIMTVVVCAVLILAIVFGPGIYRSVKMGDMVRQVWNQEQASLDLRVNDAVELRLDWTELPQGRVFVLESSGVQVCFCNGVIYLENGKGFDFIQTTEDFVQILRSSWQLLPMLKTQQQDNIWSASLEQHDLNLTLIAEKNRMESAQVLFSGKKLEIKPRPERGVLEVPAPVRAAISSGRVPGSGDLAEALIRLLGAWAELGSRNVLAMELNLSADCGPLALSETLDVRLDRNLGIGYIEKSGRGIYFKDGKVCTADGKLLAQTQADVEAAQMLGMAYLLLLNGDFTCQGNVYGLQLDQKGMEEFAYTILPAAENLNIGFESGQIQLVLEESTLDRISVSCTGNLDLILTTVQVSIGTELHMKEASIFSINQAVLDALQD